jgi:hypothetical protein
MLMTASKQATGLLLDSRNLGFDVLLPSYLN